jgi:hypothetical protein
MLIISLVLFIAEYVSLLGGESTEIIANQSWRLPIAIIGMVWVFSFLASLAIQVIHPTAVAQAKTGKRSKREVWLKSLALLAAGTGFLCIILMPSVSVNYVIIILATGLILLSLGIFLEIRK